MRYSIMDLSLHTLRGAVIPALRPRKDLGASTFDGERAQPAPLLHSRAGP